MRTLTEKRCQLANNLQNLPAEQIKKAVIELLNQEDFNAIDLESSLSTEIINFQEWIKSQRRTKS